MVWLCQCLFFYPSKKTYLRENFQLSAHEDFKLPEKKKLNLPGKKNLRRRKNSKILSKRKNSLPVKKVELSKKYLQVLNFLPEKNKMQHVKNLKICPRKFQNAQENFEKKWARKIFSTQEKKPKKGSKNWFLWQFSFSRVKKNTGQCYPGVIAEKTRGE